MSFNLHSPYEPSGDQRPAIEKLTKSIQAGNRHQTLLGVTGSGKTYSMASVIANINKPTLVMSHNKTLAAQLFSEFKNFFPDNAVEYFVSYFDYYQPEAYIPRSDTYIEKDSSINEEIERLRLSTMGSLLTRQDVLVVASVSCIYGLGSPEDYENLMLAIRIGMQMDREEFLERLVAMLYERNDIAFERGQFRVRGDVVEVFPAYQNDEAIRVEFFGDEIDRIASINPLTGNVNVSIDHHTFQPAKQFVTTADKRAKAIGAIKQELKERVDWFEENQKFLEAQRVKLRTDGDIEMIREVGFCKGIENYSRHLTGREPGATPGTLLDFFPDDFLTVVDESHATIPQIGGMYEGDRSRKTTLVEHGFRLPSALDNRPLKFDEFMDKVNQLMYVSATPATFEALNSFVGNNDFKPAKVDGKPVPKKMVKLSGSSDPVEKFNVERKGSDLIVEQIIRPTGLLDPVLTLKPLDGQIDETIELCRQRVEKGERVLVTTLTKRTAEDLTDYLMGVNLKVRYIHADVDAVERVEILRALRAAEFDILVGINLLREGLDLPEVSLVCILDADKEGYLRSETSLIQTAGRAARHINGEAVLFCDDITGSIQKLIDVTEYRRKVQQEHNEKMDIEPKSVVRSVQESLQQNLSGRMVEESVVREDKADYDVIEVIRELEGEMQEASVKLEYERAALLRDQIKELKIQAGIMEYPKKKVSYKKK